MATYRYRLTRAALAVVAASLCFASAPATADELVTLTPRPGVTQRVLLWQPSPPDPEVVFLLFPGAGGVGLEKRGDKVEARNPYLFSRHRDVVAPPQVAVAVIDAPSDQPDMDSEFRRSAKHFEDMTAVARDLKSRYPKGRLIVLGHSRGTVSAAYVAQALGDQVSAVILVSGFYERHPLRGVGLSEFDFGTLKVPVLIVHHAKDACPVTPFGPAQKLSERLPTIVVNGPDESNAGPPCVLGTNHWLVDKEKSTMEQVFNWIHGRAWARIVQ